MPMTRESSSIPPARGPSEHDVRDQIIAAASEYFRLYGYDKTTVSDLAKSIGFSKAYIYKFFGSKQAIGEVICANRLDLIKAMVDERMAVATSASERLRKMFGALVEASSDLFFHDRKLYDIAAASAREDWPSALSYMAHIRDLIKQILLEGRASGEFERKTPLDETTNAIYLVFQPYVAPLLLQHNLDNTQQATNHLTNLMLRSLAP